MESVCVGQWPLGTEPSLEYIWCSQWYTVGQTDFSLFQQVSITNISLVGGGTFDPPSLLWDFAWSEPMRILCVLSQALVVPMCIGPTGSGKHCFLGVILHLWLLQSLDSLFCVPLWALRGRAWLDEDASLGMSALKSHNLSGAQLWVSVLSTIYFKKKSSSEGWTVLWFMGIVTCPQK